MYAGVPAKYKTLFGNFLPKAPNGPSSLHSQICKNSGEGGDCGPTSNVRIVNVRIASYYHYFTAS